MSNLLTRGITGLVFVVVVIFAAWYSFWSFAGLFFFVSLIGMQEYLRMKAPETDALRKSLWLVMGMVIFMFMLFSFTWMGEKPFAWLPLCLASLMAIFALLMIAGLFSESMKPGRWMGPLALGLIYCVMFTACWFLLFVITEKWEQFWQLFLGFIFLVWANDTFAYLTGRLIGRRKLFEKISPKKTWEGTLGGVAFCLGAAYIISIYFPVLSPLKWMALAAITAPAATLGDLVESQMKREAGVKDSGSLLPGHGGILDRFDATIIASPLAVHYLLIAV